MFARWQHSRNSLELEIEEPTSGIFPGNTTTKHAQTKLQTNMNGASGSLRKLPPMSPRRESGEDNEYATVKKGKKKKRTAAEERDNEANVGLSLTDSDRTTKSKRSDSPRNSHSREDKNEKGDSTPRRKKRKKKELAPELPSPRSLPQKSSEETLSSVVGPHRKLTFSSDTNGNILNKSESNVIQNGTSKPKKTSKKKKAKKRKINIYDGPIGLAAELAGLQDDVVLARSTDDPVEDISVATPYMKSTPSDKLFMERPGGFTSSKKSLLQKRRTHLAETNIELTNQLQVSPSQTTISFALGSHNLFMTFTLFCQGMFAGIALWHIVTIQYMVKQSYDNLLTQYSEIAKPVESFYYLLFALCTVASFDRYDVHRPNRNCVFLGLTMQSGALSTVCYFVGLVFHLAATKMDDQISLSTKQNDIWPDTDKRDETLKIWWILSLVRGLAAILGWAFSAISPQVDRLRDNLENCKENVMAEEEHGYANPTFTEGV